MKKSVIFQDLDSLESVLSFVFLVLAILAVITLNAGRPVLFCLVLAGIVLNTGLQIGVFLGSLLNDR